MHGGREYDPTSLERPVLVICGGRLMTTYGKADHI